MATKKRKTSTRSPARKKTAHASPSVQTISPCLWFDSQAEEAARYYVSIFKKAKMGPVTKYPPVGQDIHKRHAGSVMTAEFVLNGLPFTALNGGPAFKFSEAISMQVLCETQAEIDYYWEKLGAGGDPQAQQCGWVKDKFGLSWQVVPEDMSKMMRDPQSPKTQRAFAAMMDMKKLDIAKLKAAYKG